MSIIEIQFREDAFCEIVKAEIIRIPPPSELIQFIYTYGQLIFPSPRQILLDHIVCEHVAIVGRTLQGAVPLPGAILLEVTIKLVLTSKENAVAAGHLAVPAPEQVIAMRFWLECTLSPERAIKFKMVEAEDERMSFVPVSGAIELGQSFPQRFMARVIQIFTAAIVAKDGVVSMRVGLSFAERDNPQAVLEYWMGNRLGSARWGLFIPGIFFANIIAAEINDAADQGVALSGDPTLEVKNRAEGSWLVPARFARAVVDMNAIDALPLGFDVPFAIGVKLMLQPNGNIGLYLDTHIYWVAGDLLTNLGLGVVQDLINDAARENMRPPASAQIETGRGDNFVDYRASIPLAGPRSHAFRTTVDVIAVDDHGVAITGSVVVLPVPTATWSATLPYWTFSGSCSSRNVVQKLHPPMVQLVGGDPFLSLWQVMGDVNSNPSWEMKERHSWPGATPVTLNVEFQPARKLLGEVQTGVPFAAFIYSNLGLRWVNFGIIPPKPAVSDRDLLGRTAALVSKCMAISDRWRMGVLHLDWLVDPPKLDLNLGFPQLKQWQISATEVEEVKFVDVTAIGADESRRPISRFPVTDNMLDFSVITELNETLELRTAVNMAGRTPNIKLRLIAPWSILSVEKPVSDVVVTGSLIKIFFLDGTVEHQYLTARSSQEKVDDGVIEPLEQCLRGDEQRAAYQMSTSLKIDWATRCEGNAVSAQCEKNDLGSSVAVLHGNRIVVGVGGEFLSAEAGAEFDSDAKAGVCGQASPNTDVTPL